MLSESFSSSNLAEWTPITTSSLGYFFSSLAKSGMTCMQLMQQKVQKSSRTTLPRARHSMGVCLFYARGRQEEQVKAKAAAGRLGLTGGCGRSTVDGSTMSPYPLLLAHLVPLGPGLHERSQ